MKKLLLLTLVLLLNILCFPANAENNDTPFVLVLTSGSCGHCEEWNEILHDYHQQADTDFEYVELVLFDQNGTLINKKALDWEGIKSFPYATVDGRLGSINQSDLPVLESLLLESKNRQRADLSVTIDASLFGDAKIKIDVSLTNNQNTAYSFTYKACITEENSRYLTANNTPYHYGFLDYLEPKEPITLQAKESYHHTHYWNGAYISDAKEQNFSEIDVNNIKIIVPIYNATTQLVDATQSTSLIQVSAYNIAPLPQIHASEEGIQNEIVALSSFGSSDPDGKIISYLWDLGDGTQYSSSNITHTFTTPGQYTIQLQVTDDEGMQNSTSQQLSIFNNTAPKITTFDMTTDAGKDDELTLSFTATESQNNSLTYSIDWGDENTTSNQTIQPNQQYQYKHIYTTSGRYLLTLTVLDIAGQKTKEEVYVYVDSTTLNYQNMTLGYLVDEDSDGVYDTYYSDDNLTKDLEISKEGLYLLDSDSDGRYDYIYDSTQKTIDTYQQEEGQTPYLFAIFLPLILFIILLIVRKRK